MIQDNEGFYFPEINKATCVGCKLCNEVCPYRKKKSLYLQPQKVYLSYNSNEKDRIESSSGGIYAAMAEFILKCGGAVVGVRFNDKYEALYDIAETLQDCLKFRYSKYVEAMDNDIYIKTKEVLEAGRKVLFTGTPCKVSGLLNYLGKDYENLHCADILCHGTNSPLILRKYLEEKQKQKPLKHFQFRSPRAPQGPTTIEFIYEGGNSEILTKRTDLFMGAFLKNVMLKRSCYKCKYCGNNGISDITFGDFWGGKKFYSKGDAGKGISCVKVNTLKGKELFTNMNVYSQEQTVEEMYAKNHKKPSKFPVQRDEIFDWINKEEMNVTAALERALKYSYKTAKKAFSEKDQFTYQTTDCKEVSDLIKRGDELNIVDFMNHENGQFLKLANHSYLPLTLDGVSLTPSFNKKKYLIPEEFPQKIITLKKQSIFLSIDWTDSSKSGTKIAKDEVILVEGIEWCSKGIPRLRIADGYITANKNFVKVAE